jgi:fumarylacetoacetase
VPEGSDFPLQNLPFGVFSAPGRPPRGGVAIGERVLDLPALGNALDGAADFDRPTLNEFLAAGPERWAAVRGRLVELLTDPRHRAVVAPALHELAAVRLHLPFTVGDFVDFYSSIDHAGNVGRIFRPDAEPLPRNWRHLPEGYHGRAGTVVVSGTPVVRPYGQRRDPTDTAPTYGPSTRLDFEAEVGFVVGVPTRLGQRVPVDALAEHVFGVVLLDDWSARDLQAWETVPLGPFLSKSFATSVSPWVVPLAALATARVPGPAQQPQPLPYLRGGADWGLDLTLQVELNGTVLSRPPFRRMYWSPAQQLAHLTANGASLRTGDLYGSGTVSGPERDQRGCLLELTWNGAEAVTLADGSRRTFLADGDTVRITATAPGAEGVRIGFGEVVGTVAPAG